MLTLAPLPPAAQTKPIVILDIEVYRNYFLVKLYYLHTKQFFSFRFTADRPFNWLALSCMLHNVTIVTFNGNKFDMLMLSAAATGRFNNSMLKDLCDAIIVGYTRFDGEFVRNGQPWMIARDFGFNILELDHIDLIEVAPGQASLKIYGGRLHCKRMQDLPIEPAAILTLQQMDDIDLYCGNDLLTTADLYLALIDDIDTRIELSEQYHMDMRSKSDAQIAESAFKKLLEPRRVYPPVIPQGTKFNFTPAPFLRFRTPVMLDAFDMVQRLPFVIAKSGQPEMPAELEAFTIKLGNSVYRLGIGGLHSSEQNAAHRADANTRLVDVDVVSYYPKIISILRMFPHQIGEVFLTIYDGWIEVRIEYKTKGNKKKAATFKIKINGTFGKTGSKYSILYAPKMMIDTTINGQFSLLMLIEMLYLQGIEVVSANTDGVVIKCRPDQEALRDATVREWEVITGFETEANAYIGLFSRDVNNYLAVKPAYTDKQGQFHPIEFKAKGSYTDFSLAKNPERMVCIDAVKEYLLNGTPLEKTIRKCDDIRRFVTVRGVQGGGEWVHDTIIAERVGEKRSALEVAGWIFEKDKGWFEPCGTNVPLTMDAAMKVIRSHAKRTYLGKAVRWYYGEGQRGHIAYASNGNMVARSEGAKPCMELPDVLPCDISYQWYVEEAQRLLKDLGVY